MFEWLYSSSIIDPKPYPEPGMVLGKVWVLEEVVSRGSSTGILKCRNTETNDIKIIKLLYPTLRNDPTLSGQFRFEAHVGKELNHQRLLTSRGLLRDPGYDGLFLEYVTGGNLDAMLTKNPTLSIEGIKMLLLHVSEALAYLNSQQILHYGVTETNILLDHEENFYLADLGSAKLNPNSPIIVKNQWNLPAEYLWPPGADYTTDIFALGTVAYRAISSSYPLQANTVFSSFNDRAPRKATSARSLRPECPGWLSDVIDRCISPDPKVRFKDAHHLFQAVKEGVNRADDWW